MSDGDVIPEESCLKGQSPSRPVEHQTAVHRARFCRFFAPDGIFKMPTATLMLENRACWSHFVPSNGRGRTGFWEFTNHFRQLYICSRIESQKGFAPMSKSLLLRLVTGFCLHVSHLVHSARLACLCCPGYFPAFIAACAAASRAIGTRNGEHDT